MKRQLIDYIRAESQCNYADIIDYTMELNQLGSDELKAKYLLDLIWFIANTENMDDEEFDAHFGID